MLSYATLPDFVQHHGDMQLDLILKLWCFPWYLYALGIEAHHFDRYTVPCLCDTLKRKYWK